MPRFLVVMTVSIVSLTPLGSVAVAALPSQASCLGQFAGSTAPVLRAGVGEEISAEARAGGADFGAEVVELAQASECPPIPR